MNSREIISSIGQIYERFSIPPNLREHMFRVAGVASLICDHWHGPAIDEEDVLATCLLHDLGNIAKMDLESEENLELLGEEKSNAEHWKDVKEKIVSEYGGRAHQATVLMVEELGADKRVRELIGREELHFEKIIAEGDDWEMKICAYSDRRVSPYGVVSMDERFREWEERYGKKIGEEEREKIKVLKKYSQMIESQVFNNCSLEPEDVTDEAVKDYVEGFRRINFIKQ